MVMWYYHDYNRAPHRTIGTSSKTLCGRSWASVVRRQFIVRTPTTAASHRHLRIWCNPPRGWNHRYQYDTYVSHDSVIACRWFWWVAGAVSAQIHESEVDGTFLCRSCLLITPAGAVREYYFPLFSSSFSLDICTIISYKYVLVQYNRQFEVTDAFFKNINRVTASLFYLEGCLPPSGITRPKLLIVVARFDSPAGSIPHSTANYVVRYL